LDTVALIKSLLALVQRHESLRTTFELERDSPVQVVHSSSLIDIQVIDLQNISETFQSSEILVLVNTTIQHPFNLSSGPLFRGRLLRVSEQDHVLLITMHHIVSDVWSLGIIVKELALFYEAFTYRKPAPLQPLTLQYPDYAVWQRQYLRDEVLKKLLAYWDERLRGVRPLELPTDRPGLLGASYRGTSYHFELPVSLSQTLLRLSREEGTTLFIALLAAFQTLLYRYTGQTDIVVGTDIANRTSIETEALIGFFVNVLVLRADFTGTPGFRKVLRQIHHSVLDAYAHQEVPFDVLVDHLQLERKRGQTPLVNVLFVMQNVSMPTIELPGLSLAPVQSEITTSKFDLAVFMQEGPAGLQGSVVYSIDLFDEQTIISMLRRFEVLLQSIVTNPDTPVDVLEISTDDEKHGKELEKKTRREKEINRLKGSKSKGIHIDLS
jgi:hypothetical protein